MSSINGFLSNQYLALDKTPAQTSEFKPIHEQKCAHLCRMTVTDSILQRAAAVTINISWRSFLFQFPPFLSPHPFSWHVQHSFWKKKFYFCRPTSIIIADKAAQREKWKVRANKVLWRVWRTEGLTGEERSCLWLSCFLFCLPSHEVVEILGLNKVFGIPWGEEELASSCHGTKTRSHIIVSISSNSRFGTI